MRSFKYFNLDNIAEAELILTSIPNHDATHYLQGIYYSHWGENKNSWVQFMGEEITPCLEPPLDKAIELNELRRTTQTLKLIQELGGLKEAEQQIQMAKVMRTMFVGTIGLRYLETLVAEYKASAKTKLNLV